MLNKMILTLLALVPMTATVSAAPTRAFEVKNEAAAMPTISVLVLHDQESAHLEVQGKFRIMDPHTGSWLSSRFKGKAREIIAKSDGLKWGEEFPGHHQIELVPTTPNSRIIVNGVEYKGKILIYDIGGSISIVNDLPIEEYLSSLMTTKYTQELAEEALAALAIAERTNALYLSKNPKNKFWAVDGSQNSFKGALTVDSASPQQQAVRSTRSMVLSKTGHYEGVITPFLAQWEKGKGSASSAITIEQANEMAKSGQHAATILEKAFPKSTILLISTSN